MDRIFYGIIKFCNINASNSSGNSFSSCFIRGCDYPICRYVLVITCNCIQPLLSRYKLNFLIIISFILSYVCVQKSFGILIGFYCSVYLRYKFYINIGTNNNILCFSYRVLFVLYLTFNSWKLICGCKYKIRSVLRLLYAIQINMFLTSMLCSSFSFVTPSLSLRRELIGIFIVKNTRVIRKQKVRK